MEQEHGPRSRPGRPTGIPDAAANYAHVRGDRLRDAAAGNSEIASTTAYRSFHGRYVSAVCASVTPAGWNPGVARPEPPRRAAPSTCPWIGARELHDRVRPRDRSREPERRHRQPPSGVVMRIISTSRSDRSLDGSSLPGGRRDKGWSAERRPCGRLNQAGIGVSKIRGPQAETSE